MKIIAIVFTIPLLTHAQNPLTRDDVFAGTFEDAQISLELSGAKGNYTGFLTVQGNRLSTKVSAIGERAAGSFRVDGQTYSFTLTSTGNGVRLSSEGREYLLIRKSDGSRDSVAREAPSGNAPSIVGSWRNAAGSARFNEDGTAVLDGESGRYEIRSNQLTLAGAKGQITVLFEIRGEVLTLTPNAGNASPIVLKRVRESGGPQGVLQELVGKWCWVSVVNAQQGARQSSQCVTLEANGSYSYTGETDSYNPYGGATSQSADAGTWTASETTLTARSRSGKITVYTLEKRNHPKNRDPMIVLNGEPFVTFYNKPPW